MNFIDILQEYNIEYKEVGEHHHCTNGWVQIDCPHCSSKNAGQFRLGYNLQGNFTSWHCGGVALTETVSLLTGLSWSKAKELLGSLEKLPDAEREIHTGKYKSPNDVGSLLDAHRKYLECRGFNPDQLVKTYKIGGTGISTALQWRIFIPIQYRGVDVSWTTRALRPKVIRYISAKPIQESIPHKKLLYAEDLARHAVIVVEGPFDAWRIGPGAVATFGMSYTKAQVLKIAKYPVRVICFDKERKAQRKARELCWLLESFPGKTYNVTLEADDPGEANAKEINELRKRFLD